MKRWLTCETSLRVTASTLLSAFFFALTLAAAPQLHALVHKDSSAPNHECAATLIASGSYQHSVAPVVFTAPQAVVYVETLSTLSPVWVATPFLGASIFEHAPPALS